MLAEDIGKIHGEPDLSTDPRARDILAAENTEIKANAAPNEILAAGHSLELASAESPIIRVPAVKLATECEPAREIVQQRNTSCVNMTPPGLYSQITRAGVPGK